MIDKETYELYLNEIEKLLELDPSVDSQEGERLLNLANLVIEYESTHFKFEKPSEEELQKFREENYKLEK